MHVERRQLSGAREWIDDASRVSAAVLAELRAWAGAEDAAESERKSVRSENLDLALRASTSAQSVRPRQSVRSEKLDSALRASTSALRASTGSTWRRAMQRGAGRAGQRHDASAASCRRDR